jgi:hypothetical protein
MFKNKPALEFSTVHSQLIELFPPKYTNKQIPNWFKNLNTGEMTNIKHCPGLTELWKDCIGIPMWRDMTITYDDKNVIDVRIAGVDASRTLEHISFHPIQQVDGAFKNVIHVKIVNPWIIKSKTLTKYYMVDALWHKHDLSKYNVLPGVLEFKHQHNCHLNIMLNLTGKEETIEFKAGTPVAYLIPQTDKKVSLKYKTITQDEYNNSLPYVWTNKHLYNRTKQWLKEKWYE